MSPTDILGILEYYKYWIIFPVAVFEGPIIAIISGFLVHLGFLNGTVTYLVLVVADMIGDSIYYTIGRSFRSSELARKYASFIGFDESSEAFLEEHFKKHKAKTFILAKISHGLGGTVQMASGIARVEYKDFVLFSFIGTLPKALILLTIGYYVGQSYVSIDKYFDLIGIVMVSVVVILIISYIMINKYAKSFLIKK